MLAGLLRLHLHFLLFPLLPVIGHFLLLHFLLLHLQPAMSLNNLVTCHSATIGPHEQVLLVKLA